jgi:citrate lyase acyl carrier protein
MKIIADAMAGTLESSDLLVKVSPSNQLEVVIQSNVIKQFGAQIRKVVDETLQKMGVTQGLVIIDDKGALDCAIRARVQCAVLRGAQQEELDWSVIQ